MVDIDQAIRSQKDRISKLATAGTRQANKGGRLLKEITEGKKTYKDHEAELHLVYADAQGILDRLSKIDDEIEEEMVKVPKVANSEAQKREYRKKMRDYAYNTKGYVNLKERLSGIIKVIGEEHRKSDPNNQKALPPPSSFQDQEQLRFDEDDDDVLPTRDQGDHHFSDNEAMLQDPDQVPRQASAASVTSTLPEEVKKQLDSNQKEIASMTKLIKDLSKKLDEMTAQKEEDKKKKPTSKPSRKDSSSSSSDSDSSEDESEKEQKKTKKKVQKKFETESEIESSEDEEKQDLNEKSRRKNRAMVKTKPIEMPTFSGENPLEYNEWRTYYMQLHGNNKETNSIVKIMLLKSFLSHEAKDLLCCVAIAKGNFKRAMKILDDHYLDKKKPKQMLQQQFNEHKIDQKDLERMSKDTTKLAAIVNEMRSKGINVDAEPIYINVIPKFNQSIQNVLYAKISRKSYDGSFDKLYKWIRNIIDTKLSVKRNIDLYSAKKKLNDFEPSGYEINAAETEENQSESEQADSDDEHPFRKEGSHPGSSGTTKKRCPFHPKGENNRHSMFYCRKTAEQKMQIIYQERKCTVCGESGHGWRQCTERDEKQCRKCEDPHCTPLHDYYVQFRANQAGITQQDGYQGGQQIQQANGNNPQNTNTHYSQYSQQFNGYPHQGPSKPTWASINQNTNNSYYNHQPGSAQIPGMGGYNGQKHQ